MKKILVTIVVIFSFQMAKSQLTNNTWSGTIKADGGDLNVVWYISSDSSYMYNLDDNALLDVSLIKVQDSTISIKKVSGLSSCDDGEGLYKFELKENEVKFFVTKDECNDRYGALDKATFVKKEK